MGQLDLEPVGPHWNVLKNNVMLVRERVIDFGGKRYSSNRCDFDNECWYDDSTQSTRSLIEMSIQCHRSP